MDFLPIRLQKAAEKHCGGINLPHDLGLVLFQEIFPPSLDEEQRYIEDQELSCPHCGGSGHKDDVNET